jgi:hypothetical protein
MLTQDIRSRVLRKVNFAIQLLRETAELLEASPTRRPHFSRGSPERDE